MSTLPFGQARRPAGHPTQSAATPAGLARGAARPAAEAGAQPKPQPPAIADESVIGKALSIVGDVVSDGAVRVDGALKGDVSCDTLTVAEGAAVEGAIRASRVVVHGSVKGQISGDTVELRSTARVAADVRHQGIGIELGARFDGALIWVDDRTARGLSGDAEI